MRVGAVMRARKRLNRALGRARLDASPMSNFLEESNYAHASNPNQSRSSLHRIKPSNASKKLHQTGRRRRGNERGLEAAGDEGGREVGAVVSRHQGVTADFHRR